MKYVKLQDNIIKFLLYIIKKKLFIYKYQSHK